MGISERIDNVTHIPRDQLTPVLPPPHSVKIELTGLCNYKCTFCARGDNLRTMKAMDWNLFTRLIDEMSDAGVEEIGLFYLGEPFMDKRLPEAIKYAKSRFPYVFLTTNGSLATPELVGECMKNGLDSLKFSLNYADGDQFEEIARVKRSLFDRMLSNMRAAKAVREHVEHHLGHRCGLYASYIEYDGDQGERMREMVEKMRPFVDEIYALPLYGQAGPQDSPLKGKMKPIGGNTGRAANPVDALPCWAVIREGHITWDGKLSACCWDHNDGLTMGDLTQTPFMEAWNSEKFQALRQAHLSGDVHGTPCESCIYGGASC